MDVRSNNQIDRKVMPRRMVDNVDIEREPSTQCTNLISLQC